MLGCVVILLLLFICLSISKELPSYLPRCYLDDPEFNKCMLRAFNQIRPNVSNGIEEIGLPSLNPFLIPNMSVLEDTPLANFTVNLFNYTTAGLDNYDIKEFQFDPETMTFYFKIEFGTIIMFAFLEIDGHVANIPIRGKGSNRHVYVRLTNDMLNANSDMVVKALTPVFEKLSEIGVMRFMKTLTKIPYYKLLPPSH
ncbi:hypothetical protein ILUMI_07977 [Ignelater luminosus]|uniref:Uncharacterized protein n=1 Tax=Ignelater luminosus TaxID=2038154 RepID=A0A8K0D707_IGNLU|nr:hypothetical protein ILUMI_07977 [Ignelater luminosus]